MCGKQVSGGGRFDHLQGKVGRRVTSDWEPHRQCW